MPAHAGLEAVRGSRRNKESGSYEGNAKVSDVVGAFACFCFALFQRVGCEYQHMLEVLQLRLVFSWDVCVSNV